MVNGLVNGASVGRNTAYLRRASIHFGVCIVKLLVTVAKEFAAAVVRAITDAKIIAEVDIIEDAPVVEDSTVELSAKLAALLTDTEADTATVVGGTARKRGKRGNGRAKLYTPAGTKKQMAKALSELRDGTLDAYVFSDLIAHPDSRNADVRDRLAKNRGFVKAGLSVESVDNVIWKMVNDGLIAKRDA